MGLLELLERSRTRVDVCSALLYCVWSVLMVEYEWIVWTKFVFINKLYYGMKRNFNDSISTPKIGFLSVYMVVINHFVAHIPPTIPTRHRYRFMATCFNSTHDFPRSLHFSTTGLRQVALGHPTLKLP